MNSSLIVIAHNIRSMHNVGAIFRNAAAFNVERLYLTGITAHPPRKEIAKVALGAEQLIPWSGGEVSEVMTQLKQEGYTVLGLELTDDAIPVADVSSKKVALVLGNEVEGIDSETLAQLDGTVVIPMGKKRSLNVSVASGIAMYEITKI